MKKSNMKRSNNITKLDPTTFPKGHETFLGELQFIIDNSINHLNDEHSKFQETLSLEKYALFLGFNEKGYIVINVQSKDRLTDSEFQQFFDEISKNTTFFDCTGLIFFHLVDIDLLEKSEEYYNYQLYFNDTRLLHEIYY